MSESDALSGDKYSKEVCVLKHANVDERISRIDAKLNWLLTTLAPLASGLLLFVGKEIFHKAFGG
jgi:tetrahydromethanopterin S-methyltransferase subunit B